MNEKFMFQKERTNEIEIIKISGILDAHTAPQLENAIKNTLEEGIVKLIINFKDLDYISSGGLGVFMAFVEEIRNKNGDIKFTAMNDKVYSIFELLGFHLIFDILQNDEEALEFFKNNKLRKNE